MHSLKWTYVLKYFYCLGNFVLSNTNSKLIVQLDNNISNSTFFSIHSDKFRWTSKLLF